MKTLDTDGLRFIDAIILQLSKTSSTNKSNEEEHMREVFRALISSLEKGNTVRSLIIKRIDEYFDYFFTNLKGTLASLNSSDNILIKSDTISTRDLMLLGSPQNGLLEVFSRQAELYNLREILGILILNPLLGPMEIMHVLQAQISIQNFQHSDNNSGLLIGIVTVLYHRMSHHLEWSHQYPIATASLLGLHTILLTKTDNRVSQTTVNDSPHLKMWVLLFGIIWFQKLSTLECLHNIEIISQKYELLFNKGHLLPSHPLENMEMGLARVVNLLAYYIWIKERSSSHNHLENVFDSLYTAIRQVNTDYNVNVLSFLQNMNILSSTSVSADQLHSKQTFENWFRNAKINILHNTSLGDFTKAALDKERTEMSKTTTPDEEQTGMNLDTEDVLISYSIDGAGDSEPANSSIVHTLEKESKVVDSTFAAQYEDSEILSEIPEVAKEEQVEEDVSSKKRRKSSKRKSLISDPLEEAPKSLRKSERGTK